MNLKQRIEQDVKNHELLACHDINTAISIIDFVALAESQPHDEAGYSVAYGVATVDIRGLLVPHMDADYSDWGITGYNHIAEYIERANADPTVSNIVLDIDSGGGYVSGIEQATDAISQSAKPIETFVSGNMYSAAYWLGATANKITATKASGIGSIGAYIVHIEESKALEQQGITPSLFRSGKYKAAFNSFMPLTDDEKKRLQDDVNETANVFFNHVSTHRSIDEKVIAEWQGDTFNAQISKDLGLIDAIANQPSTVNPTNPTLSQEDAMDLEQAKAKISKLEDLVSEKDSQLSAKDAELQQFKAQKRDDDIKALAEKTGREFTDEQIKQFKAMDEDSFKFATSFIQPTTANQAPVPSHLFSEQAMHGATQERVDDLDKKFANWSDK